MEDFGALVMYIANAMVLEDAGSQWIQVVPDELQDITYHWVKAVMEWAEELDVTGNFPQ